MLNNSPFNTFFGLHDEINHFSIFIEIPKIPVVPPISHMKSEFVLLKKRIYNIWIFLVNTSLT